MLCFLVAGALIAVGAWSNLLFLAIIICNIVIGIIQEIRAKKTIEKISLVSAPVATVMRDGHKQDISVEEVVMDDIIFFTTGKQICADCRVVEGEVEVNESLLTGESVAIKKRKGDVLYSGSFISSGKCTAIVDRVGEFSYTAKLSAKAKEYKKILDLKASDKVRDTFYSEILDIIAAYESGLADAIKSEHEKRGHILTRKEAEALFHDFENMALWKPLIQRGRVKMASRDMALRDAFHYQLAEYIQPLDKDEYQKFLGATGDELEKLMAENQEVLKRLKERD